jgi:oligosaccharide repeat unit polymerase
MGLHPQSVPLSVFPMRKGDIAGLLLLLGLSICILYFYLAKVERVALFVALQDGIKEAKIARSAMTNAFQGRYHWYNLFFEEMLSFILFAFWSNWLITKRKVSFCFFSIAFAVSSFSAIMTTQKGPFIFLLIGLFIVFFLTRRKGYVSKKGIGMVLVSIIIMLPLMYILFMGSGNWIKGVLNAFNRAFTGQIAPASFYLELFPDQKDFLLGQTFPNPGGIFPFVPYRYTIELMNILFPHYREMGIVGSMPTAFWGEAYINFGWLGVFFVPILMGVWLWILAYVLNKVRRTPVTIAGIAWLILHFKDLSMTGFSKFFFDITLISIFFIVFFVLTTTRLLSKICHFRGS